MRCARWGFTRGNGWKWARGAGELCHAYPGGGLLDGCRRGSVPGGALAMRRCRGAAIIADVRGGLNRGPGVKEVDVSGLENDITMFGRLRSGGFLEGAYSDSCPARCGAARPDSGDPIRRRKQTSKYDRSEAPGHQHRLRAPNRVHFGAIDLLILKRIAGLGKVSPPSAVIRSFDTRSSSFGRGGTGMTCSDHEVRPVSRRQFVATVSVAQAGAALRRG